MAKITRISAGKSQKSAKSAKSTKTAETMHDNRAPKPQQNTKNTKATPAETTQPTKLAKSAQSTKIKKLKFLTAPLILVKFLAKPFIKFGKYLKGAWSEIRQVHWPNRKTTWKMTGAVLIYTTLLILFILAVDAIVSTIFNQIIRK